jgi:hypothetical protein
VRLPFEVPRDAHIQKVQLLGADSQPLLHFKLFSVRVLLLDLLQVRPQHMASDI